MTCKILILLECYTELKLSAMIKYNVSSTNVAHCDLRSTLSQPKVIWHEVTKLLAFELQQKIQIFE